MYSKYCSFCMGVSRSQMATFKARHTFCIIFRVSWRPLPGFLNLFVGKLLRRNLHQIVIGQMPALHQFIQRLFSVVASGCCGFLVHTPLFVPYFREIGNT